MNRVQDVNNSAPGYKRVIAVGRQSDTNIWGTLCHFPGEGFHSKKGERGKNGVRT